MAELNLKLNINGVDTAISTINELEAALKATNESMDTLVIGSDQFNKAASNAQKLESQLKNVKLATEGVDTKQLAGSFAKLGETVAGAFAIATNAGELFGSKNDALAEAQVKAQQAIAVVMGARAIAEGVVEGRAAARLIIEKAVAINTQIVTALTIEQTAATEGAAVATTVLNTAMKALPIVALIAGIASLVYWFSTMENETKKEEAALQSLDTAIKDVNESYENQIKVQAALFGSIGKITEATGQLDEQQKEILVNQSKAAGLSQEQIDGYLKQGVQALELQTKLKTLQNQQADNAKVVKQLSGETDNATSAMAQQVTGQVELRAATTNASAAQAAQTGNVIKTVEAVKSELNLLEQKKIIDGELSDEEENRKTAALQFLEVKKQETAIAQEVLLATLSIKQAEADAANKAKDILAKKLKSTQDNQAQILKTIKDAQIQVLEQEQETEFKIREIRAQSIEDLIERENILAKIGEERNKAKIENEKAKTRNELEAKGASAKQLAEFDKTTTGLKTQVDKEADAEDIKRAEELVRHKLVVERVLRDEIAYGDFNLSDRRKKIQLEDFNFYNDLILKRVQLEIAQGGLSVIELKKKMDLEAQLVQADIQNKKDLRDEAIAADLQKDLETADAQLAAGEISNEKKVELDANGRLVEIEGLTQFELTVKGLKDQARAQEAESEEIFRAEQDAAKQAQRDKDLEAQRQLRDAGFRIASDGFKSLQSLSDLFYSIKFANIKKDSVEADKAARNQFKINKALAISTTVISTIQGVVNALTAKWAIPEPYATIGRVVSAVAVGVAGAANVAKIAATQYQSTSTPAPATVEKANVSVPGDTPQSPQGIPQSSSGGFTGFTPNALNTTGGSGGQGGQGSIGPQKVYVLEKDITDAQNRVSLAESNSTFG